MALSEAVTNKGSYEMVIGDLSCTGRETDITDCPHSGWREQKCDTAARVICKGMIILRV